MERNDPYWFCCWFVANKIFMMIALFLSDITDDKMTAYIFAFTATKTNTKASRAKLFTSS